MSLKFKLTVESLDSFFPSWYNSAASLMAPPVLHCNKIPFNVSAVFEWFGLLCMLGGIILWCRCEQGWKTAAEVQLNVVMEFLMHLLAIFVML